MVLLFQKLAHFLVAVAGFVAAKRSMARFNVGTAALRQLPTSWIISLKKDRGLADFRVGDAGAYAAAAGAASASVFAAFFVLATFGLPAAFAALGFGWDLTARGAPRVGLAVRA